MSSIIVIKGKQNIESEGYIPVNTTSRSKEAWSKELSPFFLGPIPMWGDKGHAQNLENAWQYSKVYSDQVDGDNNPTPEWFEWMRKGIAQEKAVRFPRGRGAAPLYSFWDGKKLPYVEARYTIYAPLYAAAIEKTKAYGKLKSLYEENQGKLCLFDFDGYDHRLLGLNLEQVFYNSGKKMGHGFVLAMMLENNRVWERPFDPAKVFTSKQEKSSKKGKKRNREKGDLKKDGDEKKGDTIKKRGR